MKRLFNLSYYPIVMSWFDNDFKNVEKFLIRNNLDGIEILFDQDPDISCIPKDLVLGVHLHYAPTWMEYYKQDKVNLIRQYGSYENAEAYFGYDWEQKTNERYLKEIDYCEKLDVDYAVYHVADIGLDEVFYINPFRHNDQEVLETSTELINKVFCQNHPFDLLFENLWWPGLRLDDYELSRNFIEGISHSRKGFVLDIGHMMADIGTIQTEREATIAINKRLENLRELKEDIKAVHLNSALSSEHLNKDHSDAFELFKQQDDVFERLMSAREQVRNIDLHVPFYDNSINDVLKQANPSHVVFEFLASSLDQLEQYIKIQSEVLDN